MPATPTRGHVFSVSYVPYRTHLAYICLQPDKLGEYKIVRLDDLEHLPSFINGKNSWFAYSWYSVRKDVDKGSH